LQWWNIPRRGWIIILAELAVIITLASWVYSEYVNNAYFQSYVNSLSPVLVPVVSVGFGVASATVATLLYFTLRSVRQTRGVEEEDLARKSSAAKKTTRKPQVASPRNERTSTGGLPLVPRPRALVLGTPGSKRSTTQGSRDEEDQSK
jgi:hypothetical protein